MFVCVCEVSYQLIRLTLRTETHTDELLHFHLRFVCLCVTCLSADVCVWVCVST